MSVDLPTTDVVRGLTSTEVEESRLANGANSFSELPTKTIWDFLKEAASDPVLRILILCAVASIALGAYTGHYIEGIAITAAVIIVTLVGTLNQMRAQSEYTALDAVAQRERVRVIRGGEVEEVDSEELVVGDVVEINTGDIVAADMLFARGNDLLVNEAHITGEPDTTKELGEHLYGSSRILDGSGRGIILTVGDNTTFGKIRQEIAQKDKTTPLQERLAKLAVTIGTGGKWAAIVTFLALIISGFARNEVDLELSEDFVTFLIDAVTIAITIVVVAVPEGLPLAVTISLAFTTRRMAIDKALVRELEACETMGAATIVCTDKTGTLTAGHMTLHSAEFIGLAWSSDELETIGRHQQAGEPFRDFAEAIAINSSADLIEREGQTVVAGNSTEGALLRWIVGQGIDYRPIRDSADVAIRREFNSTRKHMLTAVRRGGDSLTVYMKGAPEIVLGYCTSLLAAHGEVHAISDEGKERIIETVRDAARRGYRTLGLASASKPEATAPDDIDQGLRFDGLLIISDPLRPEVPDAVARCRKAGVRVMMITGDIRETATEIGRRSAIVSDGDLVLEGDEFRSMPDADVIERLPRITALARALPDDKKRMVELLQSQGDVVAVTGDGVNDAPALVTADVGFSMGSGSKVAREASDIVIVDDNFVTLVRAIRWGRSVFENIRKFLQFQLTINVVALTTAFVAAVLGYGTPLTAVQLLWVNLIMDSLAALSLALEPPTDELFDQPPHGRNEPLISKSMWTNIIVMGVFMFGVLAVVLTTGLVIDKNVFADDDANDLYRNTFVFNTFVWLQIFNWFNCRSVRFHRNPLKGLFKSTTFLSVVAVVIVLQILIVEFGGDVFSTDGLTARDFFKCILVGATALPVSWAIRSWGRAKNPDNHAA